MIELSVIGALSAFGAGLISFLSPCVLPLVPGYISYIGGQTLGHDQSGKNQRSLSETLATLSLSLSFVFGFSTVFIAFGASASTIGQWLLAYRYEANIFGGIIIIVFGVFISGLIRFNWLEKEFRYYGNLPGGRGLSAYLLGLAFAFGWTPCIGPILGAILTLSATSGLVSGGTALLAFYSLGLGVPFILAALFTEHFTNHSQRLKKHGRVLQIIAGGLLIIMGVAMITGYLTDFSIWILKSFPWLGELG
ncbi:MAG: cytochrome c biogenesis protein CcdA [Gammaproteobacteria bacterium]|nr:cytochrome c biogenesis protein CcdA [Gammaproteobacteria bacterium]